MATTTGFKVQCPSCEAMVTIKNASLIGKKIDCPKCKYRFVVEAPADLDGDGDDPIAAKKAGGGTAVKKAARRKAADDGDDAPKTKKKKSNLILFVGVGIVVLTLGLVAAAWFGGVFGGDEPSSSGGSGAPSKSVANNAQGGGATNPGGTPGTTPIAAEGGAASTGSVARDITNLLPNNAQWVADVDAPRALDTPAGARLFDPDKQTGTLVKAHFGVAVNEIERIVGSGGDDGAWTFTLVRTKSPMNLETMKSALDLGEPLGEIKKRAYFLAKDNPVFEAVGNFFKTKLTDMQWKIDPPPGPRQMTVCFLDAKTVAVADRRIMEKFLETDAQPEYLSRLSEGAAPGVAPGGPPGYGPPGMGLPGMGGPPGMGPPGMGPPGGAGPAGPVMPGVMGLPGSPARPQSGRPAVPDETGESRRPFSGPPMGPAGGPSYGPPGGMPGYGPPGGMPGYGPPGAPGAGGPTAPRVFTSIPTYRTVKPELKAMLNTMAAEQKPIINFAGRVKTSRIMEILFGVGLDFGGGKFKPSLPPGTKSQEVIPQAPHIGIALYELSSEKMDLRFAVDCDDEDQAKEVEKLFGGFLPLIAAAIQDEAGIPVRGGGTNSGGMPGTGFPGDPGFGPPGYGPAGGGLGPPPGYGPPAGGPGPSGPPGVPGPPGKPGGAQGAFQPNSAGANRSGPKTFLSSGGPPPGIPGGGPGAPGAPPSPGMPPGYPGGGMGGMPGYPGAPGGYPGMPGGYPGMPGSPGGQNQQKPESTVTLTRTDKLLTMKIELNWKDEFANKIRPSLGDYFDGVAGQGMLLAATHPWQKLPQAVKQLAASGKFPRAAARRPSTAARMGLPFAPEQRVSWMVELLPGLGYRALYDSIAKDLGWNSPQNLRAGRAWVPEFLDPSQESGTWRAELGSVVGRNLGATHFVGLSGIGVNAAELADTPENAKRLGIFGYERETPVAAITDGPDKTIFMIQVVPNIARPWIRGGGATVQGVTEADSFKPFRVQQANFDFGAYAIMCDGSIRFVKTGIPDNLFKAMVTYKAGDDTAGIDEWAPKVELTSRLKTGRGGATGPSGPSQYLPKDWTPIMLRTRKATFGVGVPGTAKIDMTADRAEEREFTAVWPGKNITLGAHAVYRPDLPAADANGAAAATEVTRYMELKGLTQDGSVINGPKLGASTSKQFRVKPAAGGTAIYTVWVVNDCRLVLSATGPSDMKDADAEEFFKTATVRGGSIEGPRYGKWNYWFNRESRVAVKFPEPGEPQPLGGGNLYLYWPKEAEGGAIFTVALKTADLDPTIDAAKAYAAMEKAAKQGQFGDKPTNLQKKFLGDRAGVTFDSLRGDIPYKVWAVYLNEEAAVVLSVRQNAGVSDADQKTFFDSLLVGITKLPEEQKNNPGGQPGFPGVPPGLPGAPPGNPGPPGGGAPAPGGIR